MVNFRQGLAIAAASLLLFGVAAAQAPAPVRVQVDSGTLVGTREGAAVVFRGVPFAQPPVGNLRWAPPQPVRWDGERQATSFALPCAQGTPADGSFNAGTVKGPTSEDCLYLNIWAPANATNAPVMMWLHGGGNYVGAAQNATYYGDTFAREGVILVTVSYRLGALGSFVHPALTAAANGQPVGRYALMDALAGLQWIQRNIGKFGGDPSNVTLFGQSAGGNMVEHLMASPPAKGLFAKAIIQSGGPPERPVSLAEGEALGAQIATTLGLPGANATLEQLRALPASAFYDNTQIRLGVQGVVDGKIVTMSDAQALADHALYDVPLIVGSTSGEDQTGVMHALALQGEPGAPVWEYYFSYTPRWRTAEWPSGPPHTGELPYVFDSLATSPKGGLEQVTNRDREMATRMNSCWLAFAKAPVGAKSLTCADGYVWNSRTPANDAVAVFDDAPSATTSAAIFEAVAAAKRLATVAGR